MAIVPIFCEHPSTGAGSRSGPRAVGWLGLGGDYVVTSREPLADRQAMSPGTKKWSRSDWPGRGVKVGTDQLIKAKALGFECHCGSRPRVKVATLVAAAEVAYAAQLQALGAEYDRLAAQLPRFEPREVLSTQPPVRGMRRPSMADSMVRSVSLVDRRAGEWLDDLMRMGAVLGYRASTESGRRLADEIAVFAESYSRARLAGLPDFCRSPETRYAPSVAVTRGGEVRPRPRPPTELLARGVEGGEQGLAIATVLSLYRPDDGRARTTLNLLRRFEALCAEAGTTLREADVATVGACLASCDGRSRQSVRQRLQALEAYWALSEGKQPHLPTFFDPMPQDSFAQARLKRLQRAVEEERRLRTLQGMSA